MAAPPDSARMIHALDHVVLAVRDLDTAIAGYETVLGRRCDARATADGASYGWFRLANMALALATPTEPGALGALLAARLDSAGDGLAGLAFAVGDLAQASELVQRRGLTLGTPVLLPPGRIASRAEPDTATPISVESLHGVSALLVERRTTQPAAPDAAPGAISGLDHIVVRSSAPERAVALYGGRLGLDLRLDRSNPAWGSRLLFFRCGDLVVEIAHDLTAGVSADPDSLWGLSWRVPDIEATHARLGAAGVAISELRTGRRPGTRVFTVRDRATRVPTLVLGLSTESR